LSRLQVKYPLFFSYFNILTFSRHIFEKSGNIKFHENSNRGSRVLPSGRNQRRTDGRTDGRT
jgi:hypothetical protein